MAAAQFLNLPDYYSSLSTSISGKVVGFLSVLAISGSLVLLSLKQAAGEKPAGGRSSTAEEGSDLREASAEAKEAFDYCPWRAEAGKSVKGGGKKKKKMKKVRFAPEVVDPAGSGEEYRQRCYVQASSRRGMHEHPPRRPSSPNNMIPQNRLALYKGLRQHHRLQNSYRAL